MKVDLELLAKVSYSIAWVGLAFLSFISIYVWALGTGLASGMFLTGLSPTADHYKIGFYTLYFTLIGFFSIFLFIFWNGLGKKYKIHELGVKK